MLLTPQVEHQRRIERIPLPKTASMSYPRTRIGPAALGCQHVERVIS